MSVASNAYQGISQQIQIGKIEEAEKLFSAGRSELESNGELEVVEAMMAEAVGDTPKALEVLEKCVTENEGNNLARFRLAYLFERTGCDDLAIEHYKKLVAQPECPLNAIYNLAVLLNDQNRYDLAQQCIDHALKSNPTNTAFIKLRDDIASSKSMNVTNKTGQSDDALNHILDMPVNEFELSVRSRNCLKRIKINSLRDLVTKTEQEMLSFKNFGDTSLKEIKILLKSHNLYFGMKLDGRTPPLNESSDPNARPIDTLELSTRVKRGLSQAGINLISELIEKTEEELSQIKNMGVSAILEIKEELAKNELGLKS